MQFCPLISGSSGNAAFLEAAGKRYLIDAGATGRRLSQLLDAIGVSIRTIDAVFVTHEHSDHVAGVGVLARTYHIPVYADADCFAAMPASVGVIPVDCMRVFEPDREFAVDGMRVLPFSAPHDAAHAVGYSFFAEEKKLSVMTDIGCIDDRLLQRAAGSDLLLIEANHDVDMLLAGPYPYPLKQRILSRRGHLCNEDCGQALVRLHDMGVKRVILGHLSKENNTPELARVTVEAVLRAAGVEDLQLCVALRDRPLAPVEIA